MRIDTLRLSLLAAAAGLTALAACAPGAAPASPTVQAAATQVATAAKPAVSPAATAAAAAASPAATAAAAASPAAATVTAASPVKIAGAQLGPADTTISLQNASGAAVDLSGWKLRVGSATAALPGNARVAAGETATIHTASGTSSGRDIYLGQEATALMSGLAPGANIALLDASGNVVSEFALPR